MYLCRYLHIIWVQSSLGILRTRGRELKTNLESSKSESSRAQWIGDKSSSCRCNIGAWTYRHVRTRRLGRGWLSRSQVNRNQVELNESGWSRLLEPLPGISTDGEGWMVGAEVCSGPRTRIPRRWAWRSHWRNWVAPTGQSGPELDSWFE